MTFVDSARRACTAIVDGDQRITRVEQLASDQRLGDVCSWTSFEDWETRDGLAVPRKVGRFVVQGSVTIRYELSMARFFAGSVPRETFLLGDVRRADIPTWGDTQVPGAVVEFVPVAEGVWAVELGAANARVLVVEREHDLVLLEAPDGDEVCGVLVAALGRKFTGKPIGIAAISHHHPSPSGGLRTIAATGATIVIPRGLEPYTRWLVSRPVELGELAVLGPHEPRLDVFDGQTKIDCGTEEVRLIDIGEQSAHAFHFVVFFLPNCGVLFESDLGYFPKNGGARAGPRLVGLVEALHALHVSPRRLIQAWPVRDAAGEVQWKEVEDLVRAAGDQRK